MTKSVISCGGLLNAVEFTCGDMARDVAGSVYLVTDDDTVVVIYGKLDEVGNTYDISEISLSSVPQGLSVTLTQE